VYVTLRHVRVTTVAVETEQCVLCVTVRIAEVNLPVNNIKILSVEQKCFYVGFMTPATIKGTQVPETFVRF